MTGGRLEDRGVFLRQKYCSLTCANSKHTVTEGALLWRARKLRKDVCEMCGQTMSLYAHHIDGDRTNNQPRNIQTLCLYCHNFWHSTLARRGLPIAGRAPTLGLTGGKMASPA